MSCKIKECREQHYAKGYCRYHYKWFVEAGHEDAPNTNCLMCGRQIKRRRGSKYCSATCQMKWHRRYGCYAKEGARAPIQKQGTEREAFRHKAPTACSMDGCNQPSIALGLCEAHYRTNLRHGVTVSPLGHGQRRKHHLYNSWRWQARTAEGRVEAWEDFWQFVSDVGEPKSVDHGAARHRVSDPWGPSNFYWKEIGKRTEDVNESARNWRAKNQMAAKGHGLRHSYGINLQDYIAMYETQNGKCAICGIDGATFDSVNGKTKTLAVDHCHKAKKVRALLCTDCNRGLGMFKDSPEIMSNAVKYLKKYQESTP